MATVVKNKTVSVVASVKIAKRMGAALGCFGSDFETQAFVDEILRSVPIEKFVEFKSNHVINEKKLADYEENLREVTGQEKEEAVIKKSLKSRKIWKNYFPI